MERARRETHTCFERNRGRSLHVRAAEAAGSPGAWAAPFPLHGDKSADNESVLTRTSGDARPACDCALVRRDM